MEGEEGKSVASATAETQTKSLNSTQTLPSEPPPAPPSAPPVVSAPPAVAAVAAASVQNKKRKLEDVDLRNSTYFKIRAVVKDLRPCFIEVLQTPDFRNCKAATEIRKKMKTMMDLYKQMTMERISMAKCKNTLDGQTLLSETRDKQKPVEKRQVEKPVEKRQVEKRAEQHKADKILEKSSGGKHPPGGNSHKSEDARVPGTYVVGGSPCGWNFVMYPGSKPVYYGVTKESRQVAK
ncbi:uncharacterized protein LOC122648942 isoform X2 [Telopea speciosissima]|uniref:uncharacterized protein LOC122648942 isoform X2 n=1 Tax=Telopea speciosissima TaxID=54955 RepID=UPI001CC622F0|nr:uncharacterized protein LOC122648942 isoform X2 [Telopea speciosissima]